MSDEAEQAGSLGSYGFGGRPATPILPAAGIVYYKVTAVDELGGGYGPKVARMTRTAPDGPTWTAELVADEPVIRDQLAVGATVKIKVIPETDAEIRAEIEAMEEM